LSTAPDLLAAVLVAAGNIPSDYLAAFRGCFLPGREEREVEGGKEGGGGKMYP